MLDVDGKGSDWTGQLKFGSGNYLGANYMQSVTNELAMGAEFFLLKQPGGSKFISGLGFAGRYQVRSDQLDMSQSKFPQICRSLAEIWLQLSPPPFPRS